MTKVKMLTDEKLGKLRHALEVEGKSIPEACAAADLLYNSIFHLLARDGLEIITVTQRYIVRIGSGVPRNRRSTQSIRRHTRATPGTPRQRRTPKSEESDEQFSPDDADLK